MDDKLTVEGLGHRLEGDYPCDILGLLDPSSEHSLTTREAHYVREFSGVRAGEIADAFVAGDASVAAALAAVIMRRADRRIEDEMLWNAKRGAFTFELGERKEAPAEDPPTEEGTPSLNGGTSSSSTSESPVGDLSPIGFPV